MPGRKVILWISPRSEAKVIHNVDYSNIYCLCDDEFKMINILAYGLMNIPTTTTLCNLPKEKGLYCFKDY